MKTKIINRLGAVPPLLVMFGLKQNATALARILVIGLAFLAAVPGEAASRGGTGGDTGGGIIYYIGPFPNATTGGTSVMTMMQSDGSGKTALGGGMFGDPSLVLYNNHRWFIYTYVIPGQYYPDGITKHSEVYALRDDFHPTLNNNAITAVQLTDDITLQPRVGSTTWVPGGARISFKARRWSSAEAGATVTEGGLYTASLRFGADGNIIGLVEQPVAPAIPFSLVEVTPGDPWPALADYCWDPIGSRVAYAGYGNLDLWVANLLNVHTRIFAGGAYVPQWSPAGDKIAFSHGGIATIKPDGKGFTLIIRDTSTWSFTRAYFNPAGTHIVYTGQQSGGSLGVNMDVFRATATGGSPTNLTDTPAPFNEYLHPGSGGGWR
jgi:hypothetical protein